MARDRNLLIWGSSIGSWHNPENPEGSGYVPEACDDLHMASYSARSLQYGTHIWHNLYIKT